MMDEIGLKYLENMDFEGRGEKFVEDRFISPILSLLGYDQHKDYEVKRHGDNDTSFQLNYPPVESGAKRVKHYNPDYMPTIRKKIFWIIEVKSPEITFPFKYNYIVQGLQYCIHPEIQAKYLILSNGLDTAIYDPYESVFFNQDIYEPIFHFTQKELIKNWDKIYNLLSTEKLREKIELFLQRFYEKTALSSLDKTYPEKLIKIIGENTNKLKNDISKRVIKMRVEYLDKIFDDRQNFLTSLSSTELLKEMEYPLSRGMKTEGYHYIKKLLQNKSPMDAFEKLKSEYNDSKYFKKQQLFLAICHLYNNSPQDLQKEIMSYLLSKKDEPLSVMNKTETTFLRIIRKRNIIDLFPTLRKRIERMMKTSPEIIKFTQRPSSLDVVYHDELYSHHVFYLILKKMDERKINKLHIKLLEMEKELNKTYKVARKELQKDEVELGGGFEYTGLGNPFNAIMMNMDLIPRTGIYKNTI